MLSDVPDDVPQIGFRVDAVELGGADQAIDRRSARAAIVGAAKQIVLSVMKSFS